MLSYIINCDLCVRSLSNHFSMLPRISYANIFLKNLVIYSIKRIFFKSKKTPIIMSPESKLLVILSTRLSLLVVLSVFDENRTDICK